ncbi:MAG: thioredoxin fold domain-containing protein [Aquificota bacterium]|nr:thioredoxin fold domain-containing protein [Aquificota bacterium]
MVWSLVMAFIAVLMVSCGSQDRSRVSEKPPEEVPKKVIIPEKDYALLIVESKSCIYCKQLNKDIETEKSLQEALRDIDLFRILYESYSPVRANFGGKIIETSENELARTLKALSFPHLIFYDREGNIILRIPGYLYPNQLVCVIDYVKTGAYRQEDVNSYLKRNNCA